MPATESATSLIGSSSGGSSPSGAMTGSSSTPLDLALYEVWLRLATQVIGVRVRATAPEPAVRDVLSHRPGWTLDHVTRWAGERWVAA